MNFQELTGCLDRVRRDSSVVPTLPRVQDGSPESQLCIAQILLAQHLRGEGVVVPTWREVSGLSTEVALAFLQLELSLSPSTFDAVDTVLAVEALLRTDAWDVRVEDFEAIIELCLAFDEDPLHRRVLVLLDQQADRVDPRLLLPHYERLLDTSVAPIAVDRMRALGGHVPAYAALQGHHRSLAAVRAHGVQGDRVLLLRLAGDVEGSDDVRNMAVLALGDCGQRQDLDHLLAICLRHPERMANACLSAFETLRHRGIFLQEAHLVGVFELALRARCSLEALTSHLVKERREVLMAVAVDDPRLPVWLLAFNVPEHGLSAVLVRLLDSSVYAIRASALELLAQLDHAEEEVKQAAEEAVLALAEEHGVACRRALAVIGGERTAGALLEALDEGELEETWIPVLIGLLSDGDPRLDDLEASLPAMSSYAERLWNVPRGAGRSMVRLAPKMEAKPLFVHLCSAGSLTVVPDLLRLLRERTETLGEAANVWSPAVSSRPVLNGAVVGAMESLAKAVQGRGGLEPLVGHLSSSEVPSAFVRWMLVRALDIVDDPARRAILVRSVPLDGLPASQLIAWGRTADPELRRDVLERMGEHDDVVTLGAYVIQAMADPDARIARAGARAATRMRCSAAGPALLDLLNRPRMELKRVAARGLAVLGDGRAVSSLVDWLGRHDNRGFRAELLEALQSVLPNGVRGMLAGEQGRATGRTAKLLQAAVAALDEPGVVVVWSAEEPVVGAAIPFLFRAQTFADDPTPATLDTLLVPTFGPLSVEAERVLVGLVDRLFDVLASPGPQDRREREVRGRAASGLLQWLMKRPVGLADREHRIGQLRLLPTLPMGCSRWACLQHADAVLTLGDLHQALDDCAFTATRDASMREVLAETGLEPSVVHEVVAASSAERDPLLSRLFERRPVRGWTTPVQPGWPSRALAVDSDVAVQRALDAGETVPDDWPWAPACWDDVLRVGGERRPTTYSTFLRGLFVDALPDIERTPDRLRWMASWAERPLVVYEWAGNAPESRPCRIGRVDEQTAVRSLDDVLPEVAAGVLRSATTRETALTWLATPGEERRGLRALERFPGPSVALAVRPLLDRRHLRSPALRCFRRVASRTEVCEVLREMLDDRDDEWVRSCARTLGFMRDAGSVSAFVGLLGHRSSAVRRVARQALLLVPDEASKRVRQALGRARPDRRADLREVLDVLE